MWVNNCQKPIEVGIEQGSPSVSPNAINWGRLLKHFSFTSMAPPPDVELPSINNLHLQSQIWPALCTRSKRRNDSLDIFELGLATSELERPSKLFYKKKFEMFEPECFASLEIAATSWKIFKINQHLVSFAILPSSSTYWIPNSSVTKMADGNISNNKLL